MLEGWLQTTPAHEHLRCPGCCLPTRRCFSFPRNTSQTPLLPPEKKRCPSTFPADTGASLEHPSLPPGCCQRVLGWDKSLLPSSGPGAGPGAHRAWGCSGSPAGSPRGPWGHGSRSRHRLAPPGLGWPPHSWPRGSAGVGVFWCFFNFSLEFFLGNAPGSQPPGAQDAPVPLTGLFSQQGGGFPQAGNLRLEICDNNWNGESVSECTPAGF